MARNNGQGQVGFYDPRNLKRFDLTNIDNYEQDYEIGWENKIDKILTAPKAEEMAAVFIRGNFKNERQLNACLRLSYRHKKYGDDLHQDMLVNKILGSAAINGVSRLEALFAATNLLASDMYRTARGMPRLRKGEQEQITKSSDFRQDEKPQDGGTIAARG